jgi:hypothetical protein
MDAVEYIERVLAASQPVTKLDDVYDLDALAATLPGCPCPGCTFGDPDCPCEGCAAERELGGAP